MTAAVRLAPSLLASDFANLQSEVERLAGVVDIYHVDVMDGHFVPNLTMGPGIVKALRRVTDAILDVHLMVEDPGRWVQPYREAGADWISVHFEAAPHIERVMSQIRELGARAGLVLNPGTFPRGLEYVLQEGDFVLVMSVNPGFGGQEFLPRSFDKIRRLRAELDDAGLAGVELEVDGGVDSSNAADLVRAGIDILVAGSAVYRAQDPVAAARQILDLAAGAKSDDDDRSGEVGD